MSIDKKIRITKICMSRETIRCGCCCFIVPVIIEECLCFAIPEGEYIVGLEAAVAT
jgi:hypothetical protein